ncbi:digestive cysteine proteinase 2-like, partial [Notothenia coriiceps]|uniref:Digestive cysteine proteinase 2-like n=1 Tax=Notothenia coriiceps TaxID=8208 RepID=A0A6I9MTZ9_9TELE
HGKAFGSIKCYQSPSLATRGNNHVFVVLLLHEFSRKRCPFLSEQNGFCHVNASQLTAQIKSYTNVTSGDAEALKLALFKNGPVAVSIDAGHRSFVFYSHGVYYEPACGNTTADLDHAVLAVGYGTLNQEPYWLVKNSWSTYWGNDGYILMSMKDNNCGVTTDATYVTLA